jgi:hypothetical protein
MRQPLALAAVLLFGLSCGGTSAVAVGTAPSPVSTVPSPVDVTANAAIDISSFHVIIRPEGTGRILASFSLVETGGRSSARVESIRFSDAAGETDDVGEWCWDDSPTIAPNGALDASTLGYCQPTILTKAPGASATLTVNYRSDNGQPATATASTAIRQ